MGNIKEPAKTMSSKGGKENKEAAMTINGHVVVGAEATAFTNSVPFLFFFFFSFSFLSLFRGDMDRLKRTSD